MRPFLWYYVIVAFVLDFCSLIIFRHQTDARFVIANVYLIVEFILISWYYSRRWKHAYIVGILMLVLFIGYLTINGIHHFSGSVAAILLFPTYLVYCIRDMYVILQQQRVRFIERSSAFWVNLAIITYFSGNFFLFLFLEYLTQIHHVDIIITLWIVHDILNILMQVFLALSFRQKESK